jgi:hypothetical protein
MSSKSRAQTQYPSAVVLQVAAKQMVGVYLSVWVRAGLLPHIRGVQATSVGTGIMGYLGNKGIPFNIAMLHGI